MDATLVRRIERAVRWSDPGLLRSAQALKTLGAVLLSLSASRSLGEQASLLAGLSTGFVMQCTLGRTRRSELAAMAGMGLALVVATALGIALGHRPGVAEATVVVLAFATFAVRGFLPGQAGFTLYAFIQFLVASVFPSRRPAWELLAVGGGVAIALVLYFTVLPPRRERALGDALAAFGAAMAPPLRRIARALEGAAIDRRGLDRDRRRLDRRAAVCRALIAAGPDLSALEPSLGAPYEGVHALFVLRRSVEALNAAGVRSAPLVGAIERLAAGLADPLGDGSPRIDLPDLTRRVLTPLVVMERSAPRGAAPGSQAHPVPPVPPLVGLALALRALRRLDDTRAHLALALRGLGWVP